MKARAKLRHVLTFASFHLPLLCVSAGAMAQQTATTAQTNGNAELGEIFVTATYRPQTLMDVPAAVTAISGDTLQNYQVVSLADLSHLSPSLQVYDEGAGRDLIVVRGISAYTQGGATLYPTTSVYFDDAFVTASNASAQPAIPMYDIERVEVLKGPQGTLFGASSMSGSVRFISRAPQLDEVDGQVSAASSWGDGVNPIYQGSAVVNVPVVKDLAALRITAWDSNGGGFIDRLYPVRKDNINDERTTGGRAVLLVKPSSDLSLTFTAMNEDISQPDVNDFELNAGLYNTTKPTYGKYRETYHLYTGTADYDLGFGSITATTSASDRVILSQSDTTPTAVSFGLPPADQINSPSTFKNWATEVRFVSKFSGPLQFVGGLFYDNDKTDGETDVIQTNPAIGNGPCITFTQCVALGQAAAVINSTSQGTYVDQYAVFGQIDYDITQKLTLTAGVRDYRADIHSYQINLQGVRFPTDPVQTAPQTTLDSNGVNKKVSYNVSLGYRLTDQASVYARVATGYRNGGINTTAFVTPADHVPATFTPDSITNYEIGAKTSWLDKRLYVEGALYYINWSNQQVTLVTFPLGITYIANVGKSAVKGAELEIHANPDDHWSTMFGVNYTDSRLTADQPGATPTNGLGLGGNRVPYVAPWNLTGQVEFRTPVGSAEGFVRASGNYRSGSFTNFNQYSPYYAPNQPYLLADTAIGVRSGPWESEIFAKNVTNRFAELNVGPTTDGYKVVAATPRMFGIRVTRKF